MTRPAELPPADPKLMSNYRDPSEPRVSKRWIAFALSLAVSVFAGLLVAVRGGPDWAVGAVTFLAFLLMRVRDDLAGDS